MSCDCQPKLLLRAFQVLPTTCNESGVKKEMNDSTNRYLGKMEDEEKKSSSKWGPWEK